MRKRVTGRLRQHVRGGRDVENSPGSDAGAVAGNRSGEEEDVGQGSVRAGPRDAADQSLSSGRGAVRSLGLRRAPRAARAASAGLGREVRARSKLTTDTGTVVARSLQRFVVRWRITMTGAGNPAARRAAGGRPRDAAEEEGAVRAGRYPARRAGGVVPAPRTAGTSARGQVRARLGDPVGHGVGRCGGVGALGADVARQRRDERNATTAEITTGAARMTRRLCGARATREDLGRMSRGSLSRRDRVPSIDARRGRSHAVARPYVRVSG